MAEIKSLLTAAENPHHRMMVRLALYTGLRREEIAAFPPVYVFDPDKAGQTDRNLLIRLDPFDGSGMVTKGSKRRDIHVSRRFISDLYRYVTKVRSERASLSKNPQKALFLNKSGEPYGVYKDRPQRPANRVQPRHGRQCGHPARGHSAK
ncbi:hypothetical protein [Pseudomonas fluorescens]|uniref:hypothetical protein n=1 Tax=Pseudomonas fluorescens TaxID=294 RepID=UPI002181E890|nr:hypothetical protein [Pseudomonas fluorescens]